MHACNHCRLAVRHTALPRCALLSPFCWGAFEQHMRLTGPHYVLKACLNRYSALFQEHMQIVKSPPSALP